MRIRRHLSLLSPPLVMEPNVAVGATLTQTTVVDDVLPIVIEPEPGCDVAPCPLVVNTGFEDGDLTGWTTYRTEVVTSSVRTGTYAARTTGSWGWLQNATTFECEPEGNFDAKFYVYTTQSGVELFVQLGQKESISGTDLGTYFSPAIPVTSGSWQLITVSTPWVAGVRYCRVRVNSNLGDVYFDDFCPE